MTIWSQNTSAKAIYSIATGPDIQNCRVIQADSTVTTQLILLSGASGAIIKNNIFEGGSGNIIIYATGVGGGTVADNIFMGNRALSGTSWTITPIKHSGTTKMYVYNNVFTDTYADGVQSNGTGGMDFYNNILFGGSAMPLTGSTGPLTENNNIIIQNPNIGNHENGFTKGTNTVWDVDPKFTASGKQGFIIPAIYGHYSPSPDAGYLTNYLQSIGQLLVTNSMSGTFYVDYIGPIARPQPELYRSMLTSPNFGSGAWEIGSTGWSLDLSYPATTNVGAFTCISGACGSAKWRLVAGTPVTLEIDINGDGNTDYTGNGGPYYTIGVGDLSTGAGSYTYGASDQVKAAAAADSINIAFTKATGVSGAIKMTSLSVAGWTSFGATNYISVNRTNTDCSSGACSPFYLDEVYNVKSGMETMINGDGNVIDPQTGFAYSCNSYRTPYTNNTDFNTAIRTSGFLTNMSDSGAQQNLTAFNLYDVRSFRVGAYWANNASCTVSGTPYSCCTGSGAGTCDGTSSGAAETTRLVKYLAARVAEDGLVYAFSVYAPNSIPTTNPPATGINSWETIITALADVQNRGLVKVRSAQKVQAEIIASPWTNNGDGTVSRTYGASAISDFNPTSGSPAIDAGTDASLTTDYAGNPIYGTPDIGAYEYQPPYTIGTDEVDVSAEVRVYADGKFRNIGTAGGTTADLTITPNSGSFTSDTSAWMDVTDITWNTTGDYSKQWTESSTFSGLTNTVHTIGDLEANTYYNITVDSSTTNLSGTNCNTAGSSYTCLSNSNGEITFTYTGTYSTHTFNITDVPAISGVTSVPTSTGATITWTTDEVSSSLVEYGLTSSYGTSTSEADTGTRVTSHSVLLSELSTCTRYYYRVHSKDATSNESIVVGNSFLTTDCGGGGLPSGAYTPPATPAGGFNMLINNNAETTNSPNVALFLTAGTDTKNMAISNFPDFQNATQEPYQPTKQWDLCQQRTTCPAGQYTVYVKFYTQYGQVSETVQDTISYTGTNQPTKTISQTQSQTQIEIQAQIAQIRQQLISLITQLIQMLTLQVEEMRG